MAKEKAKAEAKSKTSVKSYQDDIETEKHAMAAYSKKFASTVRSLQSDWKKYSKDVKAAAEKMREEGIENMSKKVEKFKDDIKDQIKENKEAISHMANNVKYFLSEINKKKRDFKDYAKAFFGVEKLAQK